MKFKYRSSISNENSVWIEAHTCARHSGFQRLSVKKKNVKYLSGNCLYWLHVETVTFRTYWVKQNALLKLTVIMNFCVFLLFSTWLLEDLRSMPHVTLPGDSTAPYYRVYTILLLRFLHGTHCLLETACVSVCLHGHYPVTRAPREQAPWLLCPRLSSRCWESSQHRAVLKKYLLTHSTPALSASWHAEIGVGSNHPTPRPRHRATILLAVLPSPLNLSFAEGQGLEKAEMGVDFLFAPFQKTWNLENSTTNTWLLFTKC